MAPTTNPGISRQDHLHGMRIVAAGVTDITKGWRFRDFSSFLLFFSFQSFVYFLSFFCFCFWLFFLLLHEAIWRR